MLDRVRQLVERLLEREDPLHLPGRAKRGARAGIGEHVVVLGDGTFGIGYIVLWQKPTPAPAATPPVP